MLFFSGLCNKTYKKTCDLAKSYCNIWKEGNFSFIFAVVKSEKTDS